ncbi:hypothetical protein C0J52_16932, partial [Blattella germanica]
FESGKLTSGVLHGVACEIAVTSGCKWLERHHVTSNYNSFPISLVYYCREISSDLYPSMLLLFASTSSSTLSSECLLTRTCAVFQYRCPSKTEEMINYDALCLWREMVRWLTIHVIAKAR